MATTPVKLVHGKHEQTFGIEHAERILDYQAKRNLNDWQLPEKSAFKYENGKITHRTGGTAAAGAAQEPAK